MYESDLPVKAASPKSVNEMYAPFVSDGFGSLDGKDKTPVKILGDSGATESLIVERFPSPLSSFPSFLLS